MTDLDQVAAAAGVSKATVSRAFSRPESVAERTRTRVLEVADSLNYEPSAAARALVIGKHEAIGLCVPEITNPFLPVVIDAVQREARRQGLGLLIVSVDDEAGDEYAQARLLTRRVDGIVLASPRMSDDQLRTLASRCPIVLLNRDLADIPRVLATARTGAEQAIAHLASLGHKRIGYLPGLSVYIDADRRAALVDAALAHGVELDILTEGAPVTETGAKAVDDVLDRELTAVVAFNDLIAVGLCQALTSRAVPVGAGGVSVIGFDDTWLASTVTPALTSVHTSTPDAGAVASRMLVEHLAGAEDTTPPARHMLSSELVPRDSTGPVG